MDTRLETTEMSNDTTIISELLKSAELMQPTNILPCAASSGKNDQQGSSQAHQQMINAIEKQIVIQPPSTNIDHNANNILTLSQGLNILSDSSKLSHMRHVNIPYILNGELYQIQTQDGENVTVKCCHCPPDRVYRGSVRSTGNFHMHIKRRHPDLLEKLHNMKVNALLERRDRLMRNRKVSTRNYPRNRQISIGLSTLMSQGVPSAVSIDAARGEEKINVSTSSEAALQNLSSPSDLSLAHTHKLKIKEVFERHQLQQREAAEMRNWDNCHASDIQEPINYCIKSQENNENHFSKLIPLPEQQLKHHQQELNKSDSVPQQKAGDILDTSPLIAGKNICKEPIDENQQCSSIRELSGTLSQSSTSSDLSSLSPCRRHNSNNNQLSSKPTENIHIHMNCLRGEHNGLAIIKPEQLMITTSEEEQHAIDLTMNTDSGIFSYCNESINTPCNSANAGVTNGQRAGSHHMFLPQSSGHCDGRDSSISKFQDLLRHVETSLRDIQHEMNIRNQIESNRIFLDIAKFKFLHPGFQFNW